MAENKRSNTGVNQLGPSTATGPGMNVTMVPLEGALSGAIGARVRITTTHPVITALEGTLFTACPITNLVAISTTGGGAKGSDSADYHIIPVSRIQSFQLLSLSPSFSSSTGPSFTDADPPLHALDIRALKARETAAIAKAHESEARRGKGVTREAQNLFDAFSRTMPARWDRANIIVADAVAIAPPYHADDCRPLVEGDTAALARVRKVLEMERKKIELRNASAAIGNSGAFSRTLAAGSPGVFAGQRKGG